ncbi:ROK family protein [Mariniphaga sediminis]|uniref:ROK family protein n=1 Tax=Mariniphaga sediminis TaxID=1628158 RepID=A0A399CWV0_9BACT|nr:ROK family protein [Mariniphaga sediminis]RIH62962.1 ROK family protein [Mariniphaga sediminis]
MSNVIYLKFTQISVSQCFSGFLRKSVKECQLLEIGINCGGSLDSKIGVIQSPPNLPGWDNISITKLFQQKYNVPVFLQNDANACVLVEWKIGAVKRSKNMIFMTLRIGLRNGLILNGKLYADTNDLDCEIGHIRLDEGDPEVYRKKGSFEGFCSGSGIIRMAQIMAVEKMEKGARVSFCESLDAVQNITKKDVAIAAAEGDKAAIVAFDKSAKYRGIGLSILIDILNPECIIIGSVYSRNPHLFNVVCISVIEKEALEPTWKVCEIVPAELGDKIGNFVNLIAAIDGVDGLK